VKKDTRECMNLGCCNDEMDLGKERLLSDKELDLITGGANQPQQFGTTASQTNPGQSGAPYTIEPI
jgi:hypothetical protein